MLLVGCDRETAGKYLGWTPSQLRRALQVDPQFVDRVSRAEATAEFHHMRNLYEATKDNKNWRVSVWWLEHLAPERFARKSVEAISQEEWQQFLDTLAEAIATEITCPSDRARLLARLAEMADSFRKEVQPVSHSETDCGSMRQLTFDDDSGGDFQ